MSATDLVSLHRRRMRTSLTGSAVALAAAALGLLAPPPFGDALRTLAAFALLTVAALWL